MHLILVIEGLKEKRRGILSIPLVLFGILTEGKNDRVDGHLDDSEEEGCNNITKTPTGLQREEEDSEPIRTTIIL